MLFRATRDGDVMHILKYIGDDFVAAPYLYVNLKRYSVTGPHVKVWTDLQNGKMNGVYLLYYDTLHFFSKEKRYPVFVFLDMLAKLDPKVVFMPGGYNCDLIEVIPQKYRAEKYYITDLNVTRPLAPVDGAEMAGKDDLEGIADLMLTDPEFKTVYDKSVLKAQLVSRFEEGFSRYFIIRQNGKIVAAYSTYGECEKMYILSGLVVHPDHRRRGLGTRIMNFAHSAVAADGVMGISCLRCSNAATIALHQKMGASFIASQYKFIKE